MKKDEPLQYEQMKQKALEQLRSGKSIYGKDGTFGPLLKSFLDAALEVELDSHLDKAERSRGNRRNGKTSKAIRTSSVTISVDTPRDRTSSFEPDISLAPISGSIKYGKACSINLSFLNFASISLYAFPSKSAFVSHF